MKRPPGSRRHRDLLKAIAASLAVLSIPFGCGRSEGGDSCAQRRLIVFIGSASEPPSTHAIAAFERKTGASIEAHFGGSGAMLSGLKLSGRGDVFFPGSSDYMEIAKREGLVDPDTETVIAYLIPAINVPRGNPRGVKGIFDLAQPGLRIGIARPDTVCVGLYAVEVIEGLSLSAEIKPNIVTHAESCAKVAQIVAMGQVDAVLGWEVFSRWDPERIETVLLDPAEVPRIGTLTAAVSSRTRAPGLAREFLEFLVSEEGRAFFHEAGYLTALEQARPLARPGAPAGGEWQLPSGW